MTTTIFRKTKDGACIACDSRVTWVNRQGLLIKWFDSTEYCKSISIDSVMYGFAGTNVMFKIFLQNYSTLDESEFLLDTCVKLAQEKSIQFFIIRYDGTELKLFAYSPPDIDEPEILLTSKDPAIDKDVYVIGSGKYAKEYKKHRRNLNASFPIKKIISANILGMKKSGMLHLNDKVAKQALTPKESYDAFYACKNKGGDIFTGGEVKMNQNATRQQINDQVAILDRMDQESKAQNAACASPVNARLEVNQLNSLGHYAVSPNEIEMSTRRELLLKQMRATLSASI